MPVDSRALIALLSRRQDPRLAFLPPQLQSLMAMRGGMGDPRLAQPSVGRPMGMQPPPQSFPMGNPAVAPLPQPTAPSPQFGAAPQQGGGGLLNSIFLGGIPSGLLSPQDEKAALRQGLLSAGLGLLAASGRRAQPFNFGEALLQALVLGQGAAQQTAQTSLAVQEAKRATAMEEARKRIFTKYGPQPNETTVERQDRLTNMMSELAALGSLSPGQLADYLKSTGGAEKPLIVPRGSRVVDPTTLKEALPAEEEVETIEQEIVNPATRKTESWLFNKATGEPIARLGETKERVGSLGLPVVIQTPEGYQLVDRGTGTTRPVVTRGGEPVTGVPGTGERQAAALSDVAEADVSTMRELQGDPLNPKGFKVPSFTERVAEKIPGIGGAFQDPDAQRYFDAAAALAYTYTYAVSGKQINETEARRLARSIMVQPFDKPALVRQKIARQNEWLTAVKRIAGRAKQGDETPLPVPPTDDDLYTKFGLKRPP